MDGQENEHEALEHILIDSSAKPIMLSYSFLKSITNNFSQVIGSGGFGAVYMGVLQNRKVAVKKLSETHDFSDEQFEDELKTLIRVKHKNIVRFLGYCSDTQRQVVQYKGQFVLADVRGRFLCFEYVPNGSLHDYLKDKSHGCKWDTCYQLIEGICQGLHYLHNEERINHLDLKPENILLDADLVPKITDFGLSRRFSGKQSRVITEKIRGSLGYIAPEYWNKGEISFKSDIYSLGIIIIKLLRGSDDLFDFENWHKSLDIDCPQLKRCIKIAQLCVNDDQHKRPTIIDIIDMLNEKETGIPKGPGETSSTQISSGSSETSKLLNIHPQKLRFPFEPNKRIGCPVSMTNRTDRYVGVLTVPICPDTSFDFHFPVSWILKPRSTWVETMIMKEQQHPPLRDTENFDVLMIVMWLEHDLQILKSSLGRKVNLDSDFFKQVEELGGEVHRQTLTAVICDPESCPIVTHQIISTGAHGPVLSIDVHPSKTWILTSHLGGSISIWNYQTQEMVKTLQVTKKPGMLYSMVNSSNVSPKSCVYSAKFIAQKNWFATGDGYGFIRIYSYITMDKVKTLKAHRGKPVDSLFAHPTFPFLLSSSHLDHSIKLWNWHRGWVCARTFNGHIDGVVRLMFNPKDMNTFASVGYDGTARVWSIHSSNPITTWYDLRSADFCFPDSHRHFLVTCGTPSECAYIWDVQTQQCVHRLAILGTAIRDVTCHPTIPILVTRLKNGAVCLWDASTYRLEKMVHLMDSPVQGMAFIGTEDFTRLIVSCKDGIAFVEINLKTVRAESQVHL